MVKRKRGKELIAMAGSITESRLLILIYLFAIFLTCFMTEGNTKAKTKQLKAKVRNDDMHSQITRQCSKFRTTRFRQSCRRVALNMKVFEGDSRTFGFANHSAGLQWYLNIGKNITREENGHARTVGTSPFPTPGDANCDLTCPEGNTWSLQTEQSMRSLSPWKSCGHYDPNRFPQWMQKVWCLCVGCINPATAKENRTLLSTVVKVPLTVLRKDNNLKSFDKCGKRNCYEEFEDVVVGCHCQIP